MILQVTYKLHPKINGHEYLEEVEKSGILDASRNEKGNIKYDYFFPSDASNSIILLEIWEDESSFENHKKTSHFQLFKDIKEKMVRDTEILRLDTI